MLFQNLATDHQRVESMSPPLEPGWPWATQPVKDRGTDAACLGQVIQSIQLHPDFLSWDVPPWSPASMLWESPRHSMLRLWLIPQLRSQPAASLIFYTCGRELQVIPAPTFRSSSWVPSSLWNGDKPASLCPQSPWPNKWFSKSLCFEVTCYTVSYLNRVYKGKSNTA